MLGGYTMTDFFVRNPHFCRLFLSATRALIECFMRTTHFIRRFADFFSFFVLSMVAKLLDEHVS